MNCAFRYMAEGPLVSAENVERMREILTAPIEEAEQLTEDELDEGFPEGLAE